MDNFFGEDESKNTHQNTSNCAMNATMPPSNRDKKRKMRMAIIAVALAVVCFLAGACTVWFSLDKQMRTLAKVKRMIEQQYYKEVTDEEFYGAIFDAVNNDVLDRYSQYMTADEFVSSQASMAGSRIGIGVSFSVKDQAGNAQMRIVSVSGNSPAEEAGLLAGMYLTGFGKTETEVVDSVDFEAFSAFLQPIEAGEQFVIKTEYAGTVQYFNVCKRAYVENYVFYRTKDKSYTFTGAKANVLTERGKGLSCLDEQTAYVRLKQFSGTAAENMKSALEQFKKDGKKNLVLDLRENGGGYLNTMQTIAGYFCKSAKGKKPLAAIADYGNRQEKFYADFNVYDDYFAEDSRICILADGGTASASECLIGCMVDYNTVSYGDICLSERNGVTKTYGKGIMQTTFYVGVEKDALKLTTAEIRWPSGNSIHDRGVLPKDGTKTVADNVDDDMEIAAAIAALFS